MDISIIVAVANDNIIGFENTMPWHLPADLKHFKAITTGHHVIMGRNTYESLGKPLPNRTNIVITRNKSYQVEDGVLMFNVLEDAIKHVVGKNDEEAFVIGGAEIYNLALPLSNKMYITNIDIDVDGDTYFPSFDENEWRLKDSVTHQADEINPYIYTFNNFERNLK